MSIRYRMARQVTGNNGRGARENRDMKPQKYRNIADDLRVRIKTGDLRPGQQLPTHTVLADEYGVAEGTIRKALGELTREGLVAGRRPVGVFVRDQKRYRVPAEDVNGFTAPYPNLADRLLAAMSSTERPLTQTVDVDLVVPPAEIAERLDIGDQRAVLRHRVISAGPSPVSIGDAYYPEGVASGTDIMSPVLLERGADTVLAELGLRPERLVDEVYVRMPSPTEARELRLPPGSPVLVQLCTAYAAGGEPVSCWLSVLPGDRHILVSERRREPEPRVRAVG